MTLPSRVSKISSQPVHGGTRLAVAFGRAPHVITGAQGADTVLLDVQRGKYHVLNEIASRVWDLLATKSTEDTIVETVCHEFNGPDHGTPDNLARDIRALLIALADAGLTTASSPLLRRKGGRRFRPSIPLVSSDSTGRSPESNQETIADVDRAPEECLPASIGRPPAVLTCMCLLLAVKIALRVVGFGHTALWIRQRVRTIPAVANVDSDQLRAIEHSVAMAGALFPGRALCLEQSLVLYYLLRGRGARVLFRLGVLPHPFAAHAWIEHRGIPLNDVPEHVNAFMPFRAEVL